MKTKLWLISHKNSQKLINQKAFYDALKSYHGIKKENEKLKKKCLIKRKVNGEKIQSNDINHQCHQR